MLACVTDQMPLHDGPGFALKVADGALEPFVLHVNSQSVMVQVVLHRESLSTQVANVRENA